MKRGCFINCICLSEEEIKSSGVMKKVYSQIGVLRQNFEVDHILINTYGNKQTLRKKIQRRLPYFPVDHRWEYSNSFAGYDFIYFRKSDIDYTVYRFLKRLKKNNPKCKVIFEIPTYPYGKENFHGFKDSPMYLKDVCNHNRLHECVDRIVTYTNDDVIWRIKTICTKNGVDFSLISLPTRKVPGCDIHLIEVSSPAYWHGYDRMLIGMGQYYATGGKRNIVFHIVGDGAEIKTYKELVEKYHLEEHVIFHGNQFGEGLDKVYEICYIGVDSLGRHRSNNSTNSSLKSREYAAYGLPIISAVPIDYADDNYRYLLKVDPDDSAIDINDVITFYDRIYRSETNHNEISSKIRHYAEQKCDMNITLRPIIEYILGHKSDIL